MLMIGCDYHPGFQQIACVDTETGEATERRLTHHEEAEQFYRALKAPRVRVGMEASGHARWFERLLAELQFELWIGDAAQIRTKRVRKQKTDRQDARLLLKLLREDRFPRIWVPDVENRDLRFARGRARKTPWCAVNHRRNDWASRSPSLGSSNSNHDRGCDRRDGWVGLSS
jgi:hypothetical protein